MKFGGFFSAYQDNQVFAFIVNGLFDFVAQDNNGVTHLRLADAFANFLLWCPFDFGRSPAAPSNIRSKSTYVFAQDEWHLANNFTVTYGLRYEYNTPSPTRKAASIPFFRDVSRPFFQVRPSDFCSLAIKVRHSV